MKHRNSISVLFYVAAVYEGALGLLFLFWAGAVFVAADVPPPNHMGYVQFPAALLITFGIMFCQIARGPERSYMFIPYGILLKASYCAVVFSYWFSSGIPDLWKPWALADLVFAIAFAWAYLTLRAAAKA